MNELIIDCESTIFEDGNPFSIPNKLMCVGTLFNGVYEHHDIEYSGLPYNRSIERLSQLFKQARLIVGFNLKYDLHWIRKYVPAVEFPDLYCCQLVDFIFSHQRNPYPSLDKVAEFYGLGSKLDIVKLEYWERGINTDSIPSAILNAYLRQDVLLTKAVYDKQRELFRHLPKNRQSLINLHNRDLGTLQEAEYNGMYFDSGKAKDLALATREVMNKKTSQLSSLFPEQDINYNSPQHVSAILYGGTIPQDVREQYTKVLKNGDIKIKERWSTKEVPFPRLVEPLEGTQTKNEKRDIWTTNKDVLPMLKASGKAREIIKLLLELGDLESLVSKGYEGIPNRQTKMQWEPNTIHGQFNQCVAITGRLSSSGPNLQNFTGAIKPLFYSRFN